MYFTVNEWSDCFNFKGYMQYMTREIQVTVFKNLRRISFNDEISVDSIDNPNDPFSENLVQLVKFKSLDMAGIVLESFALGIY